jgi:Na+/H+-translocating membrane pyrophosphatase
MGRAVTLLALVLCSLIVAIYGSPCDLVKCHIMVVRGGGQRADASKSQTDPLVVKVLTEAGIPVFNQTVHFFTLYNNPARIKPGFSPQSAVTNGDGEASTTVTNGFTPGSGNITISLSTKEEMTSPIAKKETFVYTTTPIYVNEVTYTEAWVQIGLILGISVLSILGAIGLAVYVLRKDQGTKAMQAVADPIKEGAQGFLRIQYITIAVISIPVAIILFIMYWVRDSSPNDPEIHLALLALIVMLSFLLGAFFSGLSGFIGMFVSVRANSRVAAAATRSYREALNVAMRSGAFAGFLVVSLSVLGVALLFTILRAAIKPELADPQQIVGMIVGFSFGCSLSALFAQLGGGIYTKAADVGADLVGKVEQNIPEDDIRNPAVIADLVGDNVGDCAGRGSDLFESISAENIGVMILAGTLAANASPQLTNPLSYILFPLMIHIVGMLSCWIGIFCVRVKDVVVQNVAAVDSYQGDHVINNVSVEREDEPILARHKVEDLEDPMKALNIGFAVSVVLVTGLFILICWWMLSSPIYTNAWWHFALCGVIGIATSWAFVFITVYYTDFNWWPVMRIVEASRTGAATNVIAGISVGFESTGMPVLVIVCAILSSYYLGQSSGIVDEMGNPIGGLFATAVATIGMLSSSSYILAMDTLGPIVDNAGGIAEMSNLPPNIRMITDRLDAVGNTTKALTKGYAIGSASLAAFLLFSAFMDTVTAYSGVAFTDVNLATPEVFVGGLLGAALVFMFSSLTIRAVGNAAQTVIEEVRRQFQERPGIMTYESKPDYEACVRIVARSALIQMIAPGLLVVVVPIVVGFLFRLIGYLNGQRFLGVEVSAGFLMVATITGILMALFLNNAGGAWDNGKKLAEMSTEYGGKGSDIHKATVIGDTIGDPFKDTAGPSIHVLIKLLATITLVIGPLFINKATAV